MPATMLAGDNICTGTKPLDAFEAGDNYFGNVNCTLQSGVLNALEQSGSNVTKGYVGSFDAQGRKPINTTYLEAGLCPVNVHWHLGTEHLSVGEYDADGVGPELGNDGYRRLGGPLL